MNMGLTADEVIRVLFDRMQRADLIGHVETERAARWLSTSPEDQRIRSALRALVGHSWRHTCEGEPEVSIPIVAVVQCDLSRLFSDEGELALEPPGQDIVPDLYFLLDVLVTHQHLFKDTMSLVHEHGWSSLTLLESAALLAQSCPSWGDSPRNLGLGSVTTQNTGIPCEGQPDPLTLHLYFKKFRAVEGINALIPRKERMNPNSWYLPHHHVAICREIVDPLKVRNRPLGTLRHLQPAKS